MKTPSTATAAAVTPGTRSACPSVSGRTWVRRCTTSRESPGTRSKRKVARNSTSFILATTLDLALLSPKVARVFHRRLRAGDVQRRIARIDFKAWQSIGGEQIGQTNLGLSKKLARRHAITRCATHERSLEQFEIPIEAASSHLKTLPPLIVHQTCLSTSGRQSQVCIVDTQAPAGVPHAT